MTVQIALAGVRDKRNGDSGPRDRNYSGGNPGEQERCSRGAR
jgi:hypothetical protein